MSARVDDGRLRLSVEDSGIGFDPASLGAQSGVGLKSVAQRLSSHYGAEARCDIQSAPGQGTTVRIELPAERHPRRALDFPARRTG